MAHLVPHSIALSVDCHPLSSSLLFCTRYPKGKVKNQRAILVGALPLWTRHEKEYMFYNLSSLCPPALGIFNLKLHFLCQ